MRPSGYLAHQEIPDPFNTTLRLYLLCRQLMNAGIGVPHEYFQNQFLPLLAMHWLPPMEKFSQRNI